MIIDIVNKLIEKDAVEQGRSFDWPTTLLLSIAISIKKINDRLEKNETK